MWKKAIALFLCLSLVLTLVPSTLAAEDGEPTEEVLIAEEPVEDGSGETEEDPIAEEPVEEDEDEPDEDEPEEDEPEEDEPEEDEPEEDEPEEDEPDEDEPEEDEPEEDEEEIPAVNMTVSIADAGEVVVACEALAVTDLDGDRKLTINDALYLAHEKFYEGGAEAGYASGESVYGLSLLKLWGKEHGGFGYYVNNESAMSLLDAVEEGDYLAAYTYSDLENWSDTYTCFEKAVLQADEGQSFEATLYAMGYDMDWNPVKTPVSGAKITINGNPTVYETDVEGKVSLSLTKDGIISADVTMEGAAVVPPVMKVAVTKLNEAKAISFSDVTPDMWCYSVVMEAARLGLLKGKDTVKRIYDPDASLTVAEFLTILYRFGEKIGQYRGKETMGANWKEAAVFMASELNVRSWSMDKPITRGEMASAVTAYILKLTQFTRRSVYTDDSRAKGYTDIDNCVYKSSILFLQKAGVINGYPDGSFKPNYYICRSEAAQIIYNLNHDLTLSA